MVKSRCLKLVTALALASLLGCQSIAPKRSMNDEPVRDITEALKVAQQQNAQLNQGQAAPDSVVADLMPPLTGSGSAPVQEARFDVSVSNVNARALFLGLVKDTRYNVVVHPDVTGKISLDLQNVTVPEVLSVVSDIYGYPVKRVGGLYQIMPAGIRTEVFKINYLNIRRQGSSETRVSSGSVSDTDSSSTSNSSSSSSLEDNDGNRNSGSNGGSLVGTQIYTSGSSDFWGELKQNLDLLIGNGDGRKVVVTPQSGMVIVRAFPAEIDIVQHYLQSAELIMKRQVILEAKILEVTLNDDFQSGINWTAFGEPGDGKSIIGSQGSAALLNADIPGFAALPGATGIASANSSNGIFGVTLNLNDFTGIIDLLETQGTVQVLSSPRISTVNNQKAVIKVGTDEFFVTEVTNSVTSSSGGTTSTPSVELTPFFSGIALDVTPQISEDDTIVLHVHPTVSEVVEQQRNFTVGTEEFELPLAQSSIRESDSIIYAKSEQVVVIGGLIQNVSNDTNGATPWVSKIPVLGNAFKQKDQSSTKRELVILLRPRVFTDEVNEDDISNSLDRFSNIYGEIDRAQRARAK